MIVNNLENAKPVRRSYTIYTQRFAEKAEILAVEAYSVFLLKRDICKIIGIILIHQATDLALKSLCLKLETTIFERGSITISFGQALSRSKNIIDKEEHEILKILNLKRNNFQHSALFDISSIDELKYLFIDTLSIISKILKNANYNPDELDLIIEIEDNEKEANL